jgi:uncharacterized membrane protein
MRGAGERAGLALFFSIAVGTLVQAGESASLGKLSPNAPTASDQAVWATVVGLVLVWVLYISGMFRWYI